MKQRKSKLDERAEDLDSWFEGEKLTLDQARAKLAEFGISVSRSRLGTWWESRQAAKMQQVILDRISSGAQSAQQIAKAFDRAPAPEVEALIRLHRFIVHQLAVNGMAEPKLLATASAMMRPVMEWARLEDRAKDRALDERRVALLEKKAAQADETKAVVESDLDPEEKMRRIRQTFGLQ